MIILRAFAFDPLELLGLVYMSARFLMTAGVPSYESWWLRVFACGVVDITQVVTHNNNVDQGIGNLGQLIGFPE